MIGSRSPATTTRTRDLIQHEKGEAGRPPLFLCVLFVAAVGLAENQHPGVFGERESLFTSGPKELLALLGADAEGRDRHPTIWMLELWHGQRRLTLTS